METFADYLLNEKELINKMDILHRLQRMLREKKGINIFFNNTVIFKTEIARMFLKYTDVGKELDENLVLTACLLCNCKKIDGPQSLESLHSYAKNGADFLSTLGFDKRFCKICEEVNRYSGSEPREPESDVLELVDNFGGMLLDRPERAGYSPEKAIMQMELETFRNKENRYFEQFKQFVGLVKRYEMVIDKTIKNKEQELENGKNRAEVEIDNSMFGQEVLEELGITKEKSGEYVMSGKQETQEQSQDDGLLR